MHPMDFSLPLLLTILHYSVSKQEVFLLLKLKSNVNFLPNKISIHAISDNIGHTSRLESKTGNDDVADYEVNEEGKLI